MQVWFSEFTMKTKILLAYRVILCWLFATVNPQILIFVLIDSASGSITKASKTLKTPLPTLSVEERQALASVADRALLNNSLTHFNKLFTKTDSKF